MKPWAILLGMTLISLCVRLWHLNSLPVILNRDEAALAYNARLLKETGKDEWGRSWPLTLESFGDYKLPGYPITLIPLFSIFGYHDWVVRLPSAIAGTLLVPVAFWFGQSIGWKKRQSLLLALGVATTPVFFFYSRIAFEANLALLLFVSSVALLLRVKQRAIWWLDLGAIIMAAWAVFTYNTPLLLLPFLIVVLPLYRGLKNWRQWMVPVVGLSLVTLFGAAQLISLSERKSGITIFQDELTWKYSVENYQRWSGVLKLILGNRVAFYGAIIAQNYIKTFSPAFVIKGEGGHPWHSVPEAGHMLGVTYALAVVGLGVTIFKKKKDLVFVYLLVVSLLPAVITVDAPHATRSLLSFFLLDILAAVGIEQMRTFLPKPFRKNFLLGVVIALCVSFGWYLSRYMTVFPSSQLSLKPAFNLLIQELDQKYPDQPIAVVDSEGFHYILVAWYLQVSPDQFFKTVVRQLPDKIGFRYGEQLGRYHFVAKKEDRTEQEKVVIEWTKKNEWEVTEP
jgi:4-amino-4-deoxy-L-arabinose transferase-like glycosyltransferase